MQAFKEEGEQLFLCKLIIGRAKSINTILTFNVELHDGYRFLDCKADLWGRKFWVNDTVQDFSIDETPILLEQVKQRIRILYKLISN